MYSSDDLIMCTQSQLHSFDSARTSDIWCAVTHDKISQLAGEMIHDLSRSGILNKTAQKVKQLRKDMREWSSGSSLTRLLQGNGYVGFLNSLRTQQWRMKQTVKSVSTLQTVQISNGWRIRYLGDVSLNLNYTG